MPPKSSSIPPEQWVLVEALFDRLMDASNPEAILEEEPDLAVAEAARRLWRTDQVAARHGFLDETITLVRQLTAPVAPFFVAGQVLAGRFTVARRLGAGGMGEVYLAQDLRLHENVAIKTIRQDLVADPAIGHRFLAEVQNARRVTHPHVCRINELFDEGATPFFTMQYLDGVPLSDWLKSAAQRPRAIRRRIALELAQGLAAAHRAGIVHCDFKPANVILTGPAGDPVPYITDFGLARAFRQPPGEVASADSGGGSGTASVEHSVMGGTRDYMAPEVQAGAPPSVASDIYSYGKVLAELLPGHPLAGHCLADRPQDRPESLDAALDTLGGPTRRVWLAGGATAIACASLGAYALLSRPRFVLASRQRVAVNWFRPDGSNSAFAVRDLLVTALRQSPRLMVMTDDRIRAILRVLNYQAKLPAETGILLAAAAREDALAVDGVLQTLGSGLRLVLQVFPQGEHRPALEISEQVTDSRQVVHLADQAALRLRREFGESAGSLRPGGAYTPLEQVTSSFPEAVDLYYRGVDEYGKAHARAALAWFDEALRIDPDFVLAHMQRGIALASQDELASALPSYEKAFALRQHVSQRERLWIEGRYYNIIGDYVSSLATCRRLVVLFPEEATYQRNVAFAATRVGRPLDALPFSQRAIELDPANDSGLSEWLVNHCDANQYDEALAKFRQFREDGHTSTLLDYGAGIAHTGRGDFAEAVKDFVRMGSAPERERWARLQGCIPLIASGEWAEAASQLMSDIAYDAAVKEELRQMTRRYWLGMLHVWMDEPWRAAAHLDVLAELDATPAWFPSLREAGMLALEVGRTDVAVRILGRLREVEGRWPSTDTRGSRALLEGLLPGHEPQETAAMLMEARGLWPDPITLYGVGRFQNRIGDYAGALTTLEMLEEARGRAYRLYFPGLVAMGRVERARTLAHLSRQGDAVLLYRQVLSDWGGRVSAFRMVRQVRDEYARLISTQPQTQGD